MPFNENAIRLLLKASTAKGFTASIAEQDNYQRIWTRDGVVNGMAALLSGNKLLVETFKQTLLTIFSNISQNGIAPSNVSVQNNEVSYGGIVGRTDNTSWAIIGLCQYYLFTKDEHILAAYQPQVEQCFAALQTWEFNDKHLIYTPQSGNWADEYFTHGYLLFDNCLRLWALQLAAKCYNNNVWKTKAQQVKTTIENNFFSNETGNYYSVAHQRMMTEEKPQHWIAGFNPSRIYNYIDVQATALGVLLEISNAAKNLAVLLSFLQKQNNMLPAFYPTINEQDRDYAELKNNFAYEFRNKPNEFHNGGLWPVWNGFVAMAFAKNNFISESMQLKNTIEIFCHNHNFNECAHGKTNLPCGVNNCAWSGGGLIIATAAINNQQLYFN